MKKVLIVCPYPHGKAPSQRFRFEQYLDIEGVEFTQVSFWNDDEWPRIYQAGSINFKVFRTIKGFGRRLRLLFQVRQFDKVFVHREATPIGPPWFEWAVVKVFRKPIIFDFDDAIWLPNSSKANEKLAGKLKFHGKTAKICSWATTVVAGNDFLADYARQNCNDVRIIPTTIDTEHHHNPNLYEKIGAKWFKKSARIEMSAANEDPKSYQDKLPLPTAIAKPLEASDQQPVADSQQPTANTNLPVIGWTGTHSTLKQLTPLFPALEKIHKKHPFRFLLIADVPPESMPAFIEFRKWQKETEIEDLLEMDIGVMPLYNTNWERGKCGFKALQYQALGIPAVVSNVGANTKVVKEGETGFICESLPLGETQKWKAELCALLENKELRIDLGKQARKHVIKTYSVTSQKMVFGRLT
ncbi:MAG: glycosyltransferase involved in cell wall biosynthesis [Cryomorphaceae bacterium]|jgi:glycosyltransferase involved in cell wall biosynthesis